MIRNSSVAPVYSNHQHPVTDSSLPFQSYIHQCRHLIEERRCLQPPPKTCVQSGSTNRGTLIECINPDVIIDANSPFEYPVHQSAKSRTRYGVLLIHGLLDSPFTLRDLARYFQQAGIYSRSILLPGHGTTPSDLLKVTYQDWLQAVQYGIDSFRHEVDHLFLLGYSTGAALAVYHALQNQPIQGVILLAPAIKIKSPLDIIMNWQSVIKWAQKKDRWLCREPEIDYAKYHSVPFNAVDQVALLTNALAKANRTHELHRPMFMALSKDDETISSKQAIQFFNAQTNRKNHLCLYTTKPKHYSDARIQTRNSHFPSLNIENFSHVALPIAASNHHYGQHGDYLNASRIDAENCLYGAYNRIEASMYDYLYQRKLSKTKRCELTYNPDFQQMAADITTFIHNAG